jgi:hypothetical protein
MTSSFSGPGVFRDHPVRPVPHQDPLQRPTEVSLAPGPENGISTGSAQPRIGFACKWEQIPQRN